MKRISVKKKLRIFDRIETVSYSCNICHDINDRHIYNQTYKGVLIHDSEIWENDVNGTGLELTEKENSKFHICSNCLLDIHKQVDKIAKNDSKHD